MTPEKICPEHGPYDASLGACPYPHSGSAPRPGAPIPLEDDLPTDIGMGSAPAPGGYAGAEDEEGVTEIPAERRHGRAADFEDEDVTEPPLLARDDDLTEIETVVTPVLGLLWIKEGARRGKYYPIKHGTVIGRKEGGLILDDPKASSMHAKFTLEGDDFVLWDLGSSNGTMVNGKNIREATVLEENDLIKVGDTVFVVKLLESKPKRKAARSGKSAGRKPRKSE